MINYDYLLSDINSIKGVGNKTAKLFKKKILILLLIYFGIYLEIILIEQMLEKLKIFK